MKGNGELCKRLTIYFFISLATYWTCAVVFVLHNQYFGTTFGSGNKFSLALVEIVNVILCCERNYDMNNSAFTCVWKIMMKATCFLILFDHMFYVF